MGEVRPGAAHVERVRLRGLKMRKYHEPRLEDLLLTRREMLHRCGMGMGAVALANLMAQAGLAAPAAADPSRPGGTRPSPVGRGGMGHTVRGPLAVREPHFPGKAKRVIHLFMNGGPSHVDTFDPKSALAKYAGKSMAKPNLPTERKTGAAFPSPFKFGKYGQSGIEVSELFPNVARHVDDMCILRSMHADVPNHEPSLLLMNCGEARLI